VVKVTQKRVTPFSNGIPRSSWWKWFKIQHLELSLGMAQQLKLSITKSLCAKNVASFYTNLKELYKKHEYVPSHVWNCDASGALARCIGGGRVLAKRNVKNVHTVIPNAREWLFVLLFVNASHTHILNLYIFKGKKMRRNFMNNKREAKN
jgi:hypothetical protein